MRRSTHLSRVAVLAIASLGAGLAVDVVAPDLGQLTSHATDVVQTGRPPSVADDGGRPRATPDPGPRTATSEPLELPAPFGSWNVVLDADAEHESIRRLSFDSPTLGLRETALVWLPDDFTPGRGDWPVVLYLHGTRGTSIHPDVDSLARDLVDAGVPLPFPVAPASTAAVTPTGQGFHETLDRHEFVVVAPDAGDLPWCASCNWVDGRDDEGVAADTYLHEDLLPLVGAALGTRTDREGVAVIGHSMGGGGALIQGFMHPDRFAFAGSSSGTLNTYDDPQSTGQVRWAYYNRTQGFEPSVVHETGIRNFNLLDLAPNTVGTGVELVAVIGDGCVDPDTWDAGSCAGATPLNDTNNFAQEVYQRYANNQVTAARLIQAGVPLTYIEREGNHGIFTSTYRRHFLDRLNEVFADPQEPPARVAYRTAHASFEAWGWEVGVERATDEFLHLLDLRTDGRGVLLGGSGAVTLTTPAAFRPRSVHTVTITPAGGEPVAHEAVADDAGRLRVVVDLGPSHIVDERDVLVEAGLRPIHQARVEVDG